MLLLYLRGHQLVSCTVLLNAPVKIRKGEVRQEGQCKRLVTFLLGLPCIGAYELSACYSAKGSPVEPTDILLKCLPENGPVAGLKSAYTMVSVAIDQSTFSSRAEIFRQKRSRHTRIAKRKRSAERRNWQASERTTTTNGRTTIATCITNQFSSKAISNSCT